MKKIILSVSMCLVGFNSFAIRETYKVDLDTTFGYQTIDTFTPVELTTNKNIRIESDYLDIAKKYTMTEQNKKTFIVKHPNKSAKTTLLVKFDSGQITKLKINFKSKKDLKGCNFRLTYGDCES